jgi:hypothetical protein
MECKYGVDMFYDGVIASKIVFPLCTFQIFVLYNYFFKPYLKCRFVCGCGRDYFN